MKTGGSLGGALFKVSVKLTDTVVEGHNVGSVDINNIMHVEQVCSLVKRYISFRLAAYGLRTKAHGLDSSVLLRAKRFSEVGGKKKRWNFASKTRTRVGSEDSDCYHWTSSDQFEGCRKDDVVSATV